MRDEIFYQTQLDQYDDQLCQIDQKLHKNPFNFSLFASGMLILSQRRSISYYFKKVYPKSEPKQPPQFPHIDECIKNLKLFDYSTS